MVVEGCKKKLLLGRSNFFLVPENGFPFYTMKMTRGGAKITPSLHKEYKKSIKGICQKWNFDFRMKNVGVKVYRNCLGNLAWSRGTSFPPHSELIYFLIPVILTNKGKVKKQVLTSLFIIKIFNLQILKFKLMFVLKIDIYWREFGKR